MTEQTSGSQGQSSSTMGASPGGRPMGAIGITLITLYLTLVTVVVFHSLVILWPPNREKVDSPGQTAAGQSGGQETRAGAQPDGTGGGTTTEPPGTDLTAEAPDSLGSDLTPLGSDLESDSGSAPSTDDVRPDEASLRCPDETQSPATLFRYYHVCLSEEERLFLIVIFAGALGGLVHTLRSFLWYAGNRKLVLSWTGFYITQPILGATLATVFYLVVRGGFFSPQSTISDTSPFGFAALAALIGMFTDQAAEKLKDVAETLFATAPKGADHAGPPTVSGVSPNQGTQAGGETVTITGSGFVQNATVTFGGQAATNVQVASGGTSLTAVTPAGTGAVSVDVTNPDGQKGSLANGFTYE